MSTVLIILGFAILYIIIANILDFLLRQAKLAQVPDWVYFLLNFTIPFVILLWHFQLRWWLAALLAFLIMIGYSVLEWIGVSFGSRLVKERPEPYKGPRCLMCGEEIYPQDTILQTQVLYVQAGNAAKAREIEKQAGYQCKQCDAKYCKHCLETRAAVSPMGGRFCPSCGGAFEYMPRTQY